MLCTLGSLSFLLGESCAGGRERDSIDDSGTTDPLLLLLGLLLLPGLLLGATALEGRLGATALEGRLAPGNGVAEAWDNSASSLLVELTHFLIARCRKGWR